MSTGNVFQVLPVEFPAFTHRQVTQEVGIVVFSVDDFVENLTLLFVGIVEVVDDQLLFAATFAEQLIEIDKF